MFFHEFKKILKNISVWGLLLLLLFVNVAVTYYIDHEELDERLYREVWEEVQMSPTEEALAMLEKRQEQSFTEEEDAVIAAVQDEIKTAQGYPEYREQIIRNAAAMRIFSQKGSFAEKNILETERHFQELGDIFTVAGPSAGVRNIFSRVTAVFLIIFLCYLGYLLFIRDGETGIETLLRTAKNGGIRFCLCKLAVHVTVTIFAVLVFYLVNVAQQNLMYGLGDMSRSIQSVLEYQSCGRIMSVQGFVLYGIVFCILIYAGVTLLIGMVCAISRNKVYMLLTLLCLSGVCAVDYVFVPLDSLWGWTKYLNPCFFLDVGEVLGKYVNLNIMNNLFSYAPALLALTLTTIFLAGVGTVLGFVRHGERGRGPSLPRPKSGRERWHFSLRYYERMKIRRDSRLLLIVILFLALAVGVSYKDRIIFTDEDDYYYYCYMKQIAGERTQEKEQFLEAENGEFDKMMEKRREMLESGEGDEALYAVTGERMRKYNGFMRVVEQDKYLKKNNLNEYVYEDGFYGLFDIRGNVENRILLLGSLVFCALVLSGVFASDEERNIGTLLRLTREGAGRQRRLKVLCSLEIAALGLLICYLPQLIVFIKLYGVEGMGAPAQCIGVWQGVGIPLAVWVWMLFRYLLYFVGLIGWTACILVLSAKTKNVLLTMLFSFVLIVIVGVV